MAVFRTPRSSPDGVRKPGEELEAVVREDATRAPLKGNAPVDKGVGRALSCKFSGGDGEHVRMTSKLIAENINIGVAPGHYRQ